MWRSEGSAICMGKKTAPLPGRKEVAMILSEGNKAKTSIRRKRAIVNRVDRITDEDRRDYWRRERWELENMGAAAPDKLDIAYGRFTQVGSWR